MVIWSFGLNDNVSSPPKKPEATFDDADLPIFAELSRLHGKVVTDQSRSGLRGETKPVAPAGTSESKKVESGSGEGKQNREAWRHQDRGQVRGGAIRWLRWTWHSRAQPGRPDGSSQSLGQQVTGH